MRKRLTKDNIKLIRTVFEGIVVAVGLYFLLTALITFRRYQPYDNVDWNIMTEENHGFVALSYTGVSREGTSTLIAESRLDEQLRVLYENGYVTVTQQDVENYYKKGTSLPEKSLFLMFEDGRTDTAIFAQRIMERYNFKASMMSYAEKFDNPDPKFLTGKQLKELEQTSFWELGTNGYRLSYINVFDRYHRYLGELSTLEFNQVAKYLKREYNHYLMDYIRDKDDVPKETRQELEDRIGIDYQNMNRIYTDQIGKLPAMYVLMHSNTGAFGTSEQASAINERWINSLFAINFNREGFSWNNRDSSHYDLTRMQPQAYWYPNHLLMRIKDDTGAPVAFEAGEEGKKQLWTEHTGASEFRDEKIILTSESEGTGKITLNQPVESQNVNLSVKLTGNKFGTQVIYLGADEGENHYLKLELRNNVFGVYEKNGGEETLLFEENLDELDGVRYLTVAEDQQKAFEGELQANLRYAESVEDAKTRWNQLQAQQQVVKEAEAAAAIRDTDLYIPVIPMNALGNRKLQVSINDGRMDLKIDGKSVVKNLPLTVSAAGSVGLETSWGGDAFSQRNLADDVYDGVFEQLTITTNNGDKETTLFTSNYSALEKWAHELWKIWNHVVNWFIDTL